MELVLASALVKERNGNVVDAQNSMASWSDWMVVGGQDEIEAGRNFKLGISFGKFLCMNAPSSFMVGLLTFFKQGDPNAILN